jgi:hypothetical protein
MCLKCCFFWNKSVETTSKQKPSEQGGGDNFLDHVTPGAFSFITQMHNPKSLSEQLTLDLNELKKQYTKLKERQRQAHIIIQTASAQNRLKTAGNNNNNNNSPSMQKSLVYQSTTSLNNNNTPSSTKAAQIPQNQFDSTSSPFSLERTPVVNHLLIKPNDMNRNTLKQTIKLSTNSSRNSTSDDHHHALDQNLADKISHSKAIIDEILKDNNIPTKKTKSSQSKPYYSDDDEDDDDDDDDDVDDYEDDGNDEEAIDEVYLDTPNKGFIENFKSTKTTENDVENLNKLSLLDLANISQTSKVDDEKMVDPIISKVYSPSLSSSSSSSTTSSVLKNTNKPKSTKTNAAAITAKQAATALVINHLINEEKRQKPPTNPFPVKHLNSNIAKNGLRLGLYK